MDGAVRVSSFLALFDFVLGCAIEIIYILMLAVAMWLMLVAMLALTITLTKSLSFVADARRQTLYVVVVGCVCSSTRRFPFPRSALRLKPSSICRKNSMRGKAYNGNWAHFDPGRFSQLSSVTTARSGSSSVTACSLEQTVCVVLSNVYYFAFVVSEHDPNSRRAVIYYLQKVRNKEITKSCGLDPVREIGAMRADLHAANSDTFHNLMATKVRVPVVLCIHGGDQGAKGRSRSSKHRTRAGSRHASTKETKVCHKKHAL